MTDFDIDADYWMLTPGKYLLSIGLFTRDKNGRVITIGRSDSHIQVTSKRESRYYFNQWTDLRRRVRKLERAVNRLF